MYKTLSNKMSNWKYNSYNKPVKAVIGPLLGIKFEPTKQEWWRRWMASGMFATMRHHAAALRETMAAQITNIRPLACMCDFMYSESSGSREGFRAYLTLIRPFAGVLTTVQLQSVICCKILSALSAKEFLRV